MHAHVQETVNKDYGESNVSQPSPYLIFKYGKRGTIFMYKESEYNIRLLYLSSPRILIKLRL